MAGERWECACVCGSSCLVCVCMLVCAEVRGGGGVKGMDMNSLASSNAAELFGKRREGSDTKAKQTQQEGPSGNQ